MLNNPPVGKNATVAFLGDIALGNQLRVTKWKSVFTRSKISNDSAGKVLLILRSKRPAVQLDGCRFESYLRSHSLFSANLTDCCGFFAFISAPVRSLSQATHCFDTDQGIDQYHRSIDLCLRLWRNCLIASDQVGQARRNVIRTEKSIWLPQQRTKGRVYRCSHLPPFTESRRNFTTALWMS